MVPRMRRSTIATLTFALALLAAPEAYAQFDTASVVGTD